MFMLKSRPEGFSGPTCSTNAYYPNQVRITIYIIVHRQNESGFLGHGGNYSPPDRIDMRTVDASGQAGHNENTAQSKITACKQMLLKPSQSV